MAIHTNSSIINFDRGIGRIATQREGDVAQALTKAKLSPTEATTSGMVERLRSAPTLEHQMRMAVMPSVSDRALLSPAHFENALQDAHSFLDPNSKDPAIQNMKTVLEDHQALRDALSYFRDLLYAG